MKRVIPVVMMLVMLMQIFSKTIIFTSFKINQDYIAQNLCENRGAPEKHCCGKCQLEKRMQKDDQKQDSRLPNSLKSMEEVVLLNEDRVNHFLFSSYYTELQYDLSIDETVPSCIGEIFHPPSLSC